MLWVPVAVFSLSALICLVLATYMLVKWGADLVARGTLLLSPRTSNAASAERFHRRSDAWDTLRGLAQLPFRLAWNALVIAAAVSLTVAWIGFVFGSVIGVVLLLLFAPDALLLPMLLLGGLVPVWPD